MKSAESAKIINMVNMFILVFILCIGQRAPQNKPLIKNLNH